jgi:hypothetical protein
MPDDINDKYREPIIDCWTEPGTMNVPGVHKSELIKKTFQS